MTREREKIENERRKEGLRERIKGTLTRQGP